MTVDRRRVVVVTWAPGGNLPPLLAAAALMEARGHDVRVLASAATRPFAERAGLGLLSYRRSPEPDTRIAFERQADVMLAAAAGPDIALDVQQVLAEAGADLAIVDCMLPAALSAARAADTPTASLVHFLYGLARRQMVAHGGGWTTDLGTLSTTHESLGIAPPASGLGHWESAQLVLVTAPRWLDVDIDYPPKVVHAGPLGVDTAAAGRARRLPGRSPTLLLSFSTTVMDGQLPAVQRVCDALAGIDARGVLTLGPAIDRAALSPPANVDVVDWSDHDRLLPQCAAVITHGGLGTLLRSLSHGVPMVLLPFGRDQAFNAGQVVELGAGISVAPDSPPAEIRTAVTTVLGEPSFSAAAAGAAARMVGDQPDRRAGDALEACGRG
jgi:UDP:flavonoid glycosyltransferase YjiC (YdhE family)